MEKKVYTVYCIFLRNILLPVLKIGFSPKVIHVILSFSFRWDVWFITVTLKALRDQDGRR